MLLEKNVLLDDISSRSAAKQSRWPSLISLFNTSATLKLGQLHRTPPSSRLTTSRQFQSDLNVSTATDRKQYGGRVVTSPEVVEVGRSSSTLPRHAFVAVDIPLVEDSVQTGSNTNVLEKGENNFMLSLPVSTFCTQSNQGHKLIATAVLVNGLSIRLHVCPVVFSRHLYKNEAV